MDDMLFSAPSALDTNHQDCSSTIIHANYFYHGIRITCRTNHPTLLHLVASIPGMSLTPVATRGALTYSLYGYASVADFPEALPRQRQRLEALQLVTHTTVKYYQDADHLALYQRFLPQPPLHGHALTVLYPSRYEALTQLELSDLDTNDATAFSTRAFLQRYIVLLALGELLRCNGFEPCHAAALTAPWDDQQGMLLLGDSGSGKTTVSLSCTLAGCGLLGDDLVMLQQATSENDDTPMLVRAHAIFQDVSVRTPSLDLWPDLAFLHALPVDQRDKRSCSIEQIRTNATRFSTPIRFLLFPTISDERTSRLFPLNKSTSLRELMRLCLSKQYGSTRPELQRQQFHLLVALAQQARSYQLVMARGTHDSTQLVCSLFAGGPG